MSYAVRILRDSISTAGFRLTTLEVTLPRIVLAELNTHRMLARNSASSRAIPVEKQISRIQEDPFVPIYWGKNQKGMQAEVELTSEEQTKAEGFWLWARDGAVDHARKLLDIGVHKQITNRILEPWMWHTVIISATEFSNFFALRCHPAAQPEIRRAAELMRDAMAACQPRLTRDYEWHLPLVDDVAMLMDGKDKTEIDPKDFMKVSTGRCARVSYLTHDGRRAPKEDLELHDKILGSGHMSPLEHAARPMTESELDDLFKQKEVLWNEEEQQFVWTGRYTHFCGNYQGWVQYRKHIPNEHDFSRVKKVST